MELLHQHLQIQQQLSLMAHCQQWQLHLVLVTPSTAGLPPHQVEFK